MPVDSASGGWSKRLGSRSRDRSGGPPSDRVRTWSCWSSVGPLAVDPSRRLAPAGPAGIARARAPGGFQPSGQRVGPVDIRPHGAVQERPTQIQPEQVGKDEAAWAGSLRASESWVTGAPVGPGRTDPPLDPSDEGGDRGGDASPVAPWPAWARRPLAVDPSRRLAPAGPAGIARATVLVWPREDFGLVGSG
jgi:hypothetical protein